MDGTLKEKAVLTRLIVKQKWIYESTTTDEAITAMLDIIEDSLHDA